MRDDRDIGEADFQSANEMLEAALRRQRAAERMSWPAMVVLWSLLGFGAFSFGMTALKIWGVF